MSQAKNKIILITSAILLSLLTLETISRVIFFALDKSLGDPMLNAKLDDKFLYQPYTGLIYKPFSEVRPKLKTDRHGFIHNGNPERNLFIKNPNQFSVFLLGGSTVAGTYVASEKTTLAAMLEARLNKLFQEKGIKLIPQVINAGISSYISSQEFALLKWYVLPLNPDYVITLDGTNDSRHYNAHVHSTNQTLKHDVHRYHQKIFQDYNQIFSFSGLLAQTMRLSSNYSALVSLLYKITKKFKKSKSVQGTDHKASQEEMNYVIEMNLTQYSRNIQASAALCNQFGIGLGYFLQPTLFDDLPNLTEKELETIRVGNYGTWHNRNYFEYKRKFYDKASFIISALKNELESDAITIEDFSKIFTSKNKKAGMSFFGDRAHYTDLGRKVIVDEILKSLGESIARKAQEIQNL